VLQLSSGKFMSHCRSRYEWIIRLGFTKGKLRPAPFLRNLPSIRNGSSLQSQARQQPDKQSQANGVQDEEW
jgi:hypothetical protein